MPKHLLVISEGFAPWGGPAAMRATKLTACGLRRGLRMSVLTTSIGCAHVFDDPDLATEVLGAEVLRVSNGTDYRLRDSISRTLGYYPTRFTDRLIALTRTQWVRNCVQAAQQQWNADRPDAIYCTPPGPQVADVAQRLSAAWDVPFVVDFRDPPWEIGLTDEQVEPILRQSDLAVFNTPPACEQVKVRHPQHSGKIECWTNGVDFPSDELPCSNFEPEAPPSIMFAGGIYAWVVDAITRLQPWVRQNRVKLEVFAFSEVKRRKQVNALKRVGVSIHQPISSRALYEKMTTVSGNLVTLPPEFQISSKIYPAVASGRAVVVYGETASSRSLLQDVPGVYSFQRTSEEVAIDELLEQVVNYKPVSGWPARYQWLMPRTWPNIFEGIFARYL